MRALILFLLVGCAGTTDTDDAPAPGLCDPPPICVQEYPENQGHFEACWVGYNHGQIDCLHGRLDPGEGAYAMGYAQGQAACGADLLCD